MIVCDLAKREKKEAEEPMKAQKEMKNDDEFDGKQKEKANLFDQLGDWFSLRGFSLFSLPVNRGGICVKIRWKILHTKKFLKSLQLRAKNRFVHRKAPALMRH